MKYKSRENPTGMRVFAGLFIIAGVSLIYVLSNTPEAKSMVGNRDRMSADSVASGELMLKISEAQTELQDRLNEYNIKAADVSRLSNSVVSQKRIMDQCQAYAEDWMPQANSYLDEASSSDHQSTKTMLHGMYIQQAGNIQKVLNLRDRAATYYENDSKTYAESILQLRQIESRINVLRSQISLYNQQLVEGR